MNILRRKWQGLPRGMVVLIAALVIYVPLLFIVAQSFLSAPFLPARKSGASKPSVLFLPTRILPGLTLRIYPRFGLVIIAIPLGGILAFNGTYRFTRQALY